MLCENCSDLDLIAALAKGYRDVKIRFGPKVWVSRISDPKRVWAWDEGKGCEFCDFIARISEDREPENLKPRFLLVHNQESIDYSRLHQDCYPIFEIMFARPTLSQEHALLEYRRGKYHAMLCTRDKTNHLNPQADLDIFRHIPPVRLRLIDCETSDIVQAPKDAPYAALSYTWGKSNNTSWRSRFCVHLYKIPVLRLLPILATGRRPPKIPLTIKDAIEATKKLGLRYLWVDAYCILQDDADDRKHQIQQMDLVYRFAEVTLIAATGDDADVGLSGVSNSASRVQKTGTFRGTTLLTCRLEPFRCVLSSYWNSRGWTFQESFFSRRRLFFGEHQILYDCAEATEVESLVYNQKAMDIPQWSSKIPTTSVFRVVSEYSKRNLSFPADALNAFKGILNAFNSREPSVKAHWGILILPNYDDNQPNFQGSRIPGLLVGLCWHQRDNALVHRQEGFPNWSWTGWKGNGIVYHYYFNSHYSNITVPCETKIYVENGNGPKIEWSDFLSRLSTQDVHHGVSQQLWLSAPSFNVRLRNSDGGLEVYANQDEQLFNGLQYAYLDSQFQDLEHLNDATSAHIDIRSCFAIFLFSLWTRERKRRWQYFLLVSKKDDFWERIGIWSPKIWSKYKCVKFGKKIEALPSYQTREFCIQ